MKINNVTITEKELCRAVELYLVTQGISLPVESAEKRYSYGSTYTINFVDKEEEDDDTLPNQEKTPAISQPSATPLEETAKFVVNLNDPLGSLALAEANRGVNL